MTQASQRIIVSGGDSDLAELIDPLKRKGVEAVLCPDGARTLEKALTWSPALVVLDTAIGLIPAQRLFHILRANPRTSSVAFCFVGREGENIDGFRRHRDFFAGRPFNRDQLLNRLLGYLNRQEKAAQVSRKESDIEGKLQQVSLVDLLQIFNFNRKDGILFLSDGDCRGEIHLVGGNIANAKVNGVEAEKAFYRLLTWDRGQFWFAPQRAERHRKISSPSEHLIMEGLRQADELAALGEVLPAPEAHVRLNVPVDKLPRGLRPATREVLLTLQYFRKVQDVLDNCSQSDFEILQILRFLLEKGIVCEDRTGTTTADRIEPLLSSLEVLAIKARLGEEDVLLAEASVKMLLLSDSVEELNLFVQRLAGIREFSLDANYQKQGRNICLGDVGRLSFGDMFSLRLVSLPAGVDLGPFWHPLRRLLFGIVSLSAGESVRRCEDFFQQAGNIPVVRFNCNDGNDKIFPESIRDRNSLKRLLGFFAAFYTGKLLPEENQ